jgi:hypothetical protein
MANLIAIESPLEHATGFGPIGLAVGDQMNPGRLLSKLYTFRKKSVLNA